MRTQGESRLWTAALFAAGASLIALHDSADGQSADSRSRSGASSSGRYVASFEPSENPTPATTSYGTDRRDAGQARPTSAGTPGSGSIRSQSGARRPDADELISFNFEDAPWEVVLKYFAEKTGLTYAPNDVPQGSFTYRDPGRYTPTEALDILNGYLIQRGYILVRQNRFLISHSLDKPVPHSLVPEVTPGELPRRGRNELLRTAFPIREVPPSEMVESVNGLLGSKPQGKAVALDPAGLLVVTDIGSNLMRIDRALEGVKQPPSELTFRSFKLQHINALEAEQLVRAQLGASQSFENVSAAASDSSGREGRSSRFSFSRGRGGDSRSDFYRRIAEMRARFGRGGGDDDRGSRSSSSSSSGTGEGKVQVTPDLRTNSLLVVAPAGQMPIVEKVIEAIDVPPDSEAPQLAEYQPPDLKVYRVRKADTIEVTKTLNAIMPGVVVNESARDRTIHVKATPEQHREVQRLIDMMDGGGAGGQVAVIPLAHMDPSLALSTINGVFARYGEDAPTVLADTFNRRIIAEGTQSQIDQIKTLLATLGEDGSGRAPNVARQQGNVRRIPVGHLDPQQILPMVERLARGSMTNPVRVVVPRNNGLDFDRRVPSLDQFGRERSPRRREEEEDRRSERESGRRSETRLDRSLPVAAAAFSVADEQGETADEDGPSAAQNADDSEAQPPESGNGKPPVAISIIGGQLVIISEDKQALDHIQELVETLAVSMPPTTRWTVFYLRAADALETAYLLGQIFPSSSVASAAGNDGGILDGFNSGISSFANSLGGTSGLSGLTAAPDALTIIPDTRTNSLLVSGSPTKVREVDNWLQILDASDTPESLRERVPRPIPVRYADVNDVYEIVRNLYEDYMQQPRSNRFGGGRSFAAFFGGDRNGNGRGDRSSGRQTQQAKLTLAVDTRTSNLLVSSSDAIFQQIQDLVRQLDEEALAAKRTVAVFNPVNTDSLILQQTLTEMIPNVQVSVTGSQTRTSTSRSGDSRGSSRSGEDAEREQRREMFRQMMMRRMMGGGQGSPTSSRFGGRSGGGDRGRSGFDFRSRFGGDRGSSSGFRGFGRGRDR